MKEQLLKLLNAAPFVPFTIKMSDGNAYEVRHPENLAIGKHFMVLIEPETDRTHDLYLLHVVSFERTPIVSS
jgi:translation elongation factor EF-4